MGGERGEAGDSTPGSARTDGTGRPQLAHKPLISVAEAVSPNEEALPQRRIRQNAALSARPNAPSVGSGGGDGTQAADATAVASAAAGGSLKNSSRVSVTAESSLLSGDNVGDIRASGANGRQLGRNSLDETPSVLSGSAEVDQQGVVGGLRAGGAEVAAAVGATKFVVGEGKVHLFRVKSYTAPVWCEVCQRLLLGVSLALCTCTSRG